jgi:tetratricopeptide (TPR) repeat protein
MDGKRLLRLWVICCIWVIAHAALAADLPDRTRVPSPNPSAEVAAAVAVGRNLRNSGNEEGALKAFDAALTKAREIRDRAGEAMALNNLASVYRYRAGVSKVSADQKPNADLVARSADLYEQALKSAQIAGNKPEMAYAELYLGVLAAGRGDSEQAFKRFKAALTAYKAIDDRYYVARTFMFMGATSLHRQQQPEAALEYFEQALPMFRDSKQWEEAQWVLRDMSVAYQQLIGQAGEQK